MATNDRTNTSGRNAGADVLERKDPRTIDSRFLREEQVGAQQRIQADREARRTETERHRGNRVTKAETKDRSHEPPVSGRASVGNVRVIPKNAPSQERDDPRSVRGAFTEGKSLSAKSATPFQANERKQQKDAEQRAKRGREGKRFLDSSGRVQSGRGSGARGPVAQVAASFTSLFASMSSRFAMTAVASFLSFLFFVFGIITLAFAAVSVTIAATPGYSWLAWFASFFTSKIPDATTLQWYSGGALAVQLVFVVVGYLVMWRWFRALKIDPMRSILAALITPVCIFCSALPVLNMFPFMVFWVWFIHANTLFLRD